MAMLKITGTVVNRSPFQLIAKTLSVHYKRTLLICSYSAKDFYVNMSFKKLSIAGNWSLNIVAEVWLGLEDLINGAKNSGKFLVLGKQTI